LAADALLAGRRFGGNQAHLGLTVLGDHDIGAADRLVDKRRQMRFRLV